ncbi:hypothetical protein COO91_05327 [Nostoc flagelliforme CCNUN1]|uniref:Uncharacterized protein n=1 Tax=Nostoc flagelliforme CCNUN1 TaxID=2038116 RepID=A0A2K8SX51_9NOSO|nr:hypothetical protein COO91_05327 [Nostoc flagelliforme CCNUN1]
MLFGHSTFFRELQKINYPILGITTTFPAPAPCPLPPAPLP